jgi:hypothetical protein
LRIDDGADFSQELQYRLLGPTGGGANR